MYGRYNTKKTISENINLPAALLSRFDLLFLLRDVANRFVCVCVCMCVCVCWCVCVCLRVRVCNLANSDLDLQLAHHVTYVHQHLEAPQRDDGENIADPKLLRDFIAQSRKVQPAVPRELTECAALPPLFYNRKPVLIYQQRSTSDAAAPQVHCGRVREHAGGGGWCAGQRRRRERAVVHDGSNAAVHPAAEPGAGAFEVER